MPRHHLAVLLPECLARILRGAKRVECRLLRSRTAPYDRVRGGDFVWLKQTSGPVLGVARVGRELDRPIGGPHDLAVIRRQYGDLIRAEPDFWTDRRETRFCTLIWLKSPTPTGPITVPKADRRAWVVLGRRPKWAANSLPADRCDNWAADFR